MEITINETRYEFRETTRELKTYFNGTTLIETEGSIFRNEKLVLPYKLHWENDTEIAFYQFENGDDTFSMSGKPNFPMEIALQVILKTLTKL